MRYIDRSLAPGEEIVVRGKWPTLYWVGAWAALLLLGIIIVGVFIFVGLAVKMLTTDFAVTNRRVILKQGWLNLKTQELSVGSIETVQLKQSLLGRIFGYGCLIVTGTGDTLLTFPPMAHAVAFRRAIEASRAHRDEVHLSPEDREALTHAAPPPEEEVAAAQPPRPKKKRGFIGLLTD